MTRIYTLLLAIALCARASADPSRDQIMAVYRQAVQKQGLSPDDFAVAFAWFLVGCDVAYFNVEPPPDDQVVRLVNTLRPSADKMSGQLAPMDRKTTLEFFVLTGTGMIVAHMQLAQRPDAAKAAALRDQAARQLQTFQIEPQTLSAMFGALGKPAAAPAPAPAAPSAPAVSQPSAPSPRKEFEVERGKGIGSGQIVAYLHSWWTGTSAYEDETYVLFKDGTVRAVPDIAFDSFDAASERAAKPARWGRWQRQGNQYAIKMGTATKFSVPSNPELFSPGRANDAFVGTFSKHRVGFNSYNSQFITLDATHRFSRSWKGGVQSMGISGDFGTPTVTTVYDQNGSSTSVSGNNIGGGTSRRNNQTADRQGTYKIDGPTIELHFDSGRVERMPFYVSANRKQIGIGDTAYWIDDKKK